MVNSSAIFINQETSILQNSQSPEKQQKITTSGKLSFSKRWYSPHQDWSCHK